MWYNEETAELRVGRQGLSPDSPRDLGTEGGVDSNQGQLCAGSNLYLPGPQFPPERVGLHVL